MKVAVDTSVIVPLLAKQTERHAVTSGVYASYMAGGAEFVVAEHVLMEAFSVLSRSPLPFGMPPEVAEALLRRYFDKAVLAGLPPGYAWSVIRHTLARGYWGGRVHDAEIALASFEAGARLLLTWDLQHFLTVAPVGLEIRAPE